MKISTSTSFVVASIALSSSALALPVPQTDPIPYARSPDLAASPHAPHSARVFQESQLAAVARPGKGRPPAIRSGSGSRRSLPRRSKTMLKRGEENDKSLSDALNSLIGTIETDLAPFGLGLITPPEKESVGQDEKDTAPHKAFRFARQIPQGAPPLSQPPIRAREQQAAASEQAEGFFPFEVPGTAAGIPGVIQGEIPGFVPGYAQPAFAGGPPFAMPNGGQPPVPEGFRGIPPQAMGELQTGESSVPAGTVGEAAGEVPSELQTAGANTPAGGVLSGLPLGSVVGLPGQVVGGTPLGGMLSGLSPSQIEGIEAELLGSTRGGMAGNAVPGGVTNALSGMTGSLNGVTGSLPIVGGLNAFGALEGVPSNGKQESASESASEEPQSESSTSSSSASASETTSTTTLPSTSLTASSETTNSSVSPSDSSSVTSSSSVSNAESTFAVNVGPDPAAAASSHSLPTGSHSLPVPAPAQSAASEAPAPQAPSPPIIHVEAPSPTPSQTESATETSSSSDASSSSSSATESSSSPSASMSTSSTSSTDATESTSSSTVNPVERRRLLSRIMRHFRREDPPLPKGFAAPTGPIPNDTPPLLKSTVNYPADKVEKDQASATSSVTSSVASESQTESSEDCSSESTVSRAESTSISTA